MMSSPCRWSRSRAEDLAEFGGPIKHTQGLEVWSCRYGRWRWCIWRSPRLATSAPPPTLGDSSHDRVVQVLRGVLQGTVSTSWGRWRAYRLKAIVPSRWSPCRSWLGKKTVPSEEVCRMALGADCVPDRDAAGTASVVSWLHLHRRGELCWCACTRPRREADGCERGLVRWRAAVGGGHSGA
jgi:hypothetical protein